MELSRPGVGRREELGSSASEVSEVSQSREGTGTPCLCVACSWARAALGRGRGLGHLRGAVPGVRLPPATSPPHPLPVLGASKVCTPKGNPGSGCWCPLLLSGTGSGPESRRLPCRTGLLPHPGCPPGSGPSGPETRIPGESPHGRSSRPPPPVVSAGTAGPSGASWVFSLEDSVLAGLGRLVDRGARRDTALLAWERPRLPHAWARWARRDRRGFGAEPPAGALWPPLLCLPCPPSEATASGGGPFAS